MRSYWPNRTGLTLIELITAATLIGIIMIGVIAFSLMIQQMHFSTQKASILKVRLASLFVHITKNVYSATGNLTDTGIRVPAADRFCVRQQDSNATPSTNNDPWVKYYIAKNSDNVDELFFCSTGLTFDGACVANTTEKLLTNITAHSFSVNSDQILDFLVTFVYDAKNPKIDFLKNPQYTLKTKFLSGFINSSK